MTLGTAAQSTATTSSFMDGLLLILDVIHSTLQRNNSVAGQLVSEAVSLCCLLNQQL